MIVRIVCGGGNDPYDRDDYMETRLKAVEIHSNSISGIGNKIFCTKNHLSSVPNPFLNNE